ncbi:unnamed protein product [Moneuplotes crassus]|uniref:RING-type E3 ubiquitin transferase n=1 Tax=Euplotes crassus TaxID=5936 RepID=A0AAD1UL80_EUPCR|nr:unnamed protein product [Moneuplotes crassus]
MESYSFLANIDSEINQVGDTSHDFEIRPTQTRPPVSREKMFKYKKIKPTVRLNQAKYEEEKKEIKRLEMVNQQRKMMMMKKKKKPMRRSNHLPPPRAPARAPARDSSMRRETTQLQRPQAINSREERRRNISQHVQRFFTDAETALSQMNIQQEVENTYGNMDERLDEIERALDEINISVNNPEGFKEHKNENIFNKWINTISQDRFVSRWITEKANKSKGDDVCNICLDVYNINDRTLTLPCSHDFHYSCLKEWFKKKPECPKCRRAFK